MKKLIALLFCLAVLTTVARAEYPAQAPQKTTALQKAVTQKVQAAQNAVPVKIDGDKRLITVRLEVQEPDDNERYTLHRYWYCPAVIFTKDGALAFDGECWKAVEEASKKSLGPSVMFNVYLGKFGEYASGENFGNEFFFESSYVVGEGPVVSNENGVEVFKRSADHSYITYNLSLFNDPENSEVKQAISTYYAKNKLKAVTAETLSKYFRQKHPTTESELWRNPFVR